MSTLLSEKQNENQLDDSAQSGETDSYPTSHQEQGNPCGGHETKEANLNAEDESSHVTPRSTNKFDILMQIGEISGKVGFFKRENDELKAELMRRKLKDEEEEKERKEMENDERRKKRRIGFYFEIGFTI